MNVEVHQAYPWKLLSNAQVMPLIIASPCLKSVIRPVIMLSRFNLVSIIEQNELGAESEDNLTNHSRVVKPYSNQQDMFTNQKHLATYYYNEN